METCVSVSCRRAAMPTGFSSTRVSDGIAKMQNNTGLRLSVRSIAARGTDTEMGIRAH